MGRPLPPPHDTADDRDEAALAERIDTIVARVAPAQAAEPGSAQADAAADRVLAELDGSGTADATEGERPDRPPSPIAFLDALEVTQEVQDLAHSVPLVAGKATVVRAYLRYARRPVQVRGELRVSRSPHGPWRTIPSLGTTQLDPARAGRSLAELRSRRADLSASLNFLLPPDLTAAGRVWLRLGRVRRAGGGALPSLAHLPVAAAQFRQGVPMRLRLVRLRYTMGSPPVTHQPSATDVALIASWLRRAYPIARLQVTTTTATAAPAAPFTAAQINAQLIALRAVDVATGTDARTHYYGMVADSGFFMRGRASGIPQTPLPGTVASGPTGSGGFTWDTDGSYGDWYGAHELGHTLGRFHAEFCGAGGGRPYPFPDGQLSGADEVFVGLDVGDPALGLPMTVMGGTDAHDVMTYCDDQWLSSFTYGGIYDRVVAEDGLAAGAGGPAGAGGAPPELTEAEGSGMRVIAALNLTRATGSITSVLPSALVSADRSARPPDAAPDEAVATTITVRAVDASGEVLDEWRAPFQRTACEEPDDDVTGVVDTVVPATPGAARIEVLIDGAVADAQAVGGEAAPVGDLIEARPESAGPGTGAGGMVEVRWDAPDGPPGQRYIVQVSDDEGASWRTVAVGLVSPAVTLPTDDVTTDRLDVRVLATTGTTTSVVRSDTVEIRGSR